MRRPQKKDLREALNLASIAAMAPLERGSAAFREHADHAAEILALPTKVKAKDFSTKAAIAFGKSLGWLVLHVEEDRAFKVDDVWVRRKQDLKCGVDVVFRDPETRAVVAVQSGGRYERKAHHERFLARGGNAVALSLYDRVEYWEFLRGNPVPVVRERWGTA